MAEDDGSRRDLVLTKHALFGFGFSFVGGSQDALPLVIADILGGSPADLCGQLAVGDILLAVNDINVSYMTLNEVVNLICSGGEKVTLKIKSGSLADLTNDGCSYRAREESPSRQCQTRRSNNGRLKLRHKSHIDSDLAFNVRHSLSSEFSSSGESSVISERNKEPYSAVPLRLSTNMTDGLGDTIGKGANGGMGSDRDLNGCGSEYMIATGQVLKEPRFETFLMTGDMIIKTTKIPALSRIRHDVEAVTLENAEKTESQPTSCLPKEIHSSRNEALCQSRKISRTLPDVVQRNCFANILPETLSALPQSISEYDLPQQQDNKLLQEGFMCPDFSNVYFELDIPPDDISSEDERFRIEERAFNMDDLPPPPDEFLTDSKLYVPFSDEGSRLHSACDQDVDFEPLPVNQTVPFALDQECCGGDATAVYPVVKGVIASSRSEESLSPKLLSDNQPLFFQGVSATVRGSRSQDNYLQYSTDGIVVDIDFGEQTSTSVDTLHYQNLCSSLSRLGPAHIQVGQNSHSLPKYRSPVECQNSTGFQTAVGMDMSNLENASVVGSECPISDDSITELYFGGDIAPPESFRSSDSGIACTSSVHEADERDGNLCARASEGLCRDGSFDTSTNVSDVGLDCQMLRKASFSHELQYIIDSAKTVASGLNGQEQPLSASITDETFGGINSSESEEESFHFPCKDVDRPSAQRLAQRLFGLKGFQKKDVSKHLGKKNEFAQLVGEEYLKHFDFTSQSLDFALRFFLQRLVLSGETQERERILAHFSHRHVECNPGSFSSEDACHTLTCAMLLLNTDLHIQNVGHKMTLDEFIENLADLNDGENYPKHLLQSIYCSIQKEPIVVDEEELQDVEAAGPKRQCLTLSSNPFLDVRDPSKATEFKTGCVMRKCCVDPDGRRTGLGKRSWKMFFASLRDMVLYLYKDEQGLRQQAQFPNMNNAVHLHHSLATLADDYKKKHHVFRLRTSDGAEFLFQTGDSKECESWIDQINYVTAAFSSPPLPCAVGSQRKFQRPLMPCSHTRLSLVNQLHHHQTMLNQIELELGEHKQSPPDKGSKSRIIQDYLDKESYLEYEIKRFTTYCSVLESNQSKQGLPSEDQTDKSHANAFSQKQSQKSGSVQRSKSDRYRLKAATLSHRSSPRPDLVTVNL